jgi:hypothetical protein
MDVRLLVACRLVSFVSFVLLLTMIVVLFAVYPNGVAAGKTARMIIGNISIIYPLPATPPPPPCSRAPKTVIVTEMRDIKARGLFADRTEYYFVLEDDQVIRVYPRSLAAEYEAGKEFSVVYCGMKAIELSYQQP